MKLPQQAKRLAPAAIAFVCVLVGTLLVIPSENSTTNAVSRVPVLIVNRPLPAGTPTDEVRRNVEVKEIPSEAALQGAFSSAAAIPTGVLASTHAAGQQLSPISFAENRIEAIGPDYVVTSVLLAPEQWVGAVKVAGATVTAYAITEESVSAVAVDAIVIDSPSLGDLDQVDNTVIALAVRRESLAEVLRASALKQLWLVGG